MAAAISITTDHWKGAVIGVTIALGLVILTKWIKKPPASVIGIHTTIERIRHIGEYVSLVCSAQSVLSYLDEKWWGDKGGIYIGKGVAKLGFNFSNVMVKEENKSIIFYMPVIELIGFKDDEITIYHEKGSLFRKITTADRNKMWNEVRTQFKSGIVNNPDFQDQAKDSAEKFLGTFFRTLPGIKENYDIRFVWKAEQGIREK